jgi:hypothetical protein
MTDEQTEIQKVLDKFAKRRGRKDWKTYTKGAETLFFCERDIATLAYRAGRESRDADILLCPECHEVLDKCEPETHYEEGNRRKPVKFSPYECPKHGIKTFRKLASQRGDDVNYELSGKFSINNFTFNPTTSNL